MGMSKRKRAPLPPPCRLCAPYDGAWTTSGDSRHFGLIRCSCPRGRALAQGAQRVVRKNRTTEKHDGKMKGSGK